MLIFRLNRLLLRQTRANAIKSPRRLKLTLARQLLLDWSTEHGETEHGACL